jgi:hypothetical protein
MRLSRHDEPRKRRRLPSGRFCLMAIAVTLALGVGGSAIAAGGGTSPDQARAASAQISRGGVHLSYERETEAVVPNSQVFSNPECKGQSEVVGGGVLSHVGFAQGAGMMINSSYPETEDNAWFANVDAFQNAGVHISAYAICTTSGTGHLRYVKEEEFVGPNEQGHAIVDCPGGSEVLSGGVRSPLGFADGGGMMVNTSAPLDDKDRDRRADDGWRARVDAFRNVSPNTLMTVYAVCTFGGQGELFYERESDKKLNPNSQDGETVQCPRRSSVVGGGVSTNVDFAGGWGEMINSSFPLDTGEDPNRKPDDAWRADVDLFRNVPSDARIDVYAICVD